MPLLSWNETRDRAIAFSREWKDAAHEEQQKHHFWIGFFECFGIPLKSVAVFERAVENLKGHYSFLDLFWPGVLLVEHKSRGASLDKAESQAFAYLADLAREGQHDQLPRYVILCDFARFLLYDLEPDDQRDLPLFDDGKAYCVVEFPLADLHKNIREFAFIRGEKPVRLDPEDPANLKATQLLADLHDELEQTGYTGHALERYLVRLLFCLFAEDTAIFDPPGMFTALVESTPDDGAGLGPKLQQLWEVLNTDAHSRQSTLDEDLAAFPYVNGGLFSEPLRTCHFTRTQRTALIACCRFYWARISPAVFGSLFQGILGKKQRRQLGAHYTTERDILKLLNALFIDDLRDELADALADRSTRRTERLRDFQKKLRRLLIFDPACGCGNFLILAYRELRRLENAVVVALHTIGGKIQQQLNVRELVHVDVDQFYGLEIGEWPVRIAEVGLWLADHQCNVELADALGQNFRRLPLRATPSIKVCNALHEDWRAFLPPHEDILVVGNPPFVGKKEQNPEQKKDMERIWGAVKGSGILDYVTCWYKKAADYIIGSRIRCAFVSTNSISQGEQVGILWGHLFQHYHLKIHFAHRTFSWASEASGKAQVDVVIIGFGAFDRSPKHLYEYARHDGEPVVSVVPNINPYLVSGNDTTVSTRTRSISDAPQIFYGSMMIDKDRGSGDECGLILTQEHRAALIAESPALKPFIRRLFGGDEFINDTVRWCLWLVGASPALIRSSPRLMARIETVRAFREQSSRPQTKLLATTPTLFGEIRQPDERYLLIPKVSSENRAYIPIGFLEPIHIASGSALVIPGATNFHFGVLSSAMHNAWNRAVGGRLESRYQYSNNIVYNNFPWPTPLEARHRSAIETCAQSILDARAQFPSSTLADLYDPLAMPAALAKAHAALNHAVDRAYAAASGIRASDPFPTERLRVEHLFALYEKLIAPLLPVTKVKKRKFTLYEKLIAPLLPPTKTKKSGANKSEQTIFGDSDGGESDEDEEKADQSRSGLPQWYLDAFKPHGVDLMRGELKTHNLQTIYARIDEMLAVGDFTQCDDLLRGVANEHERTPLATLVGLLTATRAASEQLTNRRLLHEVTEKRLSAAGHNPTEVLRGL